MPGRGGIGSYPRSFYWPRYADFRDFSGGLNLIAAPSELAQNETPDCLNVTLDERGGIVKRLGLAKQGEISAVTGTPLILYYSRVVDRLLMQVGANLYSSSNGGVTWGASIKTFSTSARVGMCDFIGKLVIIHPVDGTFTWDGATFSGKVTNSPNGNTITAWQNCLISAGDPAQPVRVTRSDIGAITWPVTPVFNDFRVKDDAPVTAVIPGSGLDMTARGALLVFKEESTYRINDITTLAYSTIDPTYGASGPLCVALNFGGVVALNRRGIISTDGTTAPKLLSTKLEPLFRATQESYQTSADWCAGSYRDRFVFSLRRTSGAGPNDTTLELHPGFGWIVRHSFGVQGFSNYVPNDRRLLGAKNAATTNAAAFEVFKGGTDDGAAISAYFQTPWFDLAGGTLTRLLRLRRVGRGNFQTETRVNYSQTGLTRNFTGPSSGAHWGSVNWGSFLWGASELEITSDAFSLGVAKYVSTVVKQTSSTSQNGPKLLGDGVAPEIGDFGCYELAYAYIHLGAP